MWALSSPVPEPGPAHENYRCRRQGEDRTTELVVTEMLPTAEDAWVTDTQGRRYASEAAAASRRPGEAGMKRLDDAGAVACGGLLRKTADRARLAQEVMAERSTV